MLAKKVTEMTKDTVVLRCLEADMVSYAVQQT